VRSAPRAMLRLTFTIKGAAQPRPHARCFIAEATRAATDHARRRCQRMLFIIHHPDHSTTYGAARERKAVRRVIRRARYYYAARRACRTRARYNMRFVVIRERRRRRCARCAKHRCYCLMILMTNERAWRGSGARDEAGAGSAAARSTLITAQRVGIVWKRLINGSARRSSRRVAMRDDDDDVIRERACHVFAVAMPPP